MGAVRPIVLAEGQQLVPLAQACALLGSPSVAALRARIYRAIASPDTSPEEQGFQKVGGRWFVLVQRPVPGAAVPGEATRSTATRSAADPEPWVAAPRD